MVSGGTKDFFIVNLQAFYIEMTALRSVMLNNFTRLSFIHNFWTLPTEMAHASISTSSDQNIWFIQNKCRSDIRCVNFKDLLNFTFYINFVVNNETVILDKGQSDFFRYRTNEVSSEEPILFFNYLNNICLICLFAIESKESIILWIKHLRVSFAETARKLQGVILNLDVNIFVRLDRSLSLRLFSRFSLDYRLRSVV